MKKIYSNPEISITEFNNQDSILLTSQAAPTDTNTVGIFGTTLSSGNWNS